MSIYAVNGKTPIAAWIPSRDTAGNGTTTLTDLVGSNNGTLTNMDAATDWVADTGAGGVRALDFDGVNDYVETTYFIPSGAPQFSLSMWIYPRSAAVQYFIDNSAGSSSAGNGRNFRFSYETGSRIIYRHGGGAIAHAAGAIDTWQHFACVIPPLSATTDDVIVYINGIISGGTRVAGSSQSLDILSAAMRFGVWNGRSDDTRAWEQSLTDTDIAALYAAQRGGITAAAIPQTRRRRDQRNQYGGGL